MFKVIVVDDNSYHRKHIVSIVNAIAGFIVIKEAIDGVDAIWYLYNSKNMPDMVVLDIEMRRLDGITVMDHISEHFPTIKVIGCTGHATINVINDLFACGAMGFVNKLQVVENPHLKAMGSPMYICKKGNSVIEDALKSVANNTPYVDERIDYDITKRDILIAERKNNKEGITKKYKLTKRQKEIIGLNVFEMDYKTIGGIINISERTVEGNIANLTKKFATQNGREGVMAFCIKWGASVVAKLKSKCNLKSSSSLQILHSLWFWWIALYYICHLNKLTSVCIVE